MTDRSVAGENEYAGTRATVGLLSSVLEIVVPDSSSNEIFQSAVRNAALFKSVIAVVGLACVYMGYRLLASHGLAGRPGPADESTLRPRAIERVAPGLVLLAFGIITIAAALFRSAPISLRDEHEVQGAGPRGTTQDIYPITKSNSPRDSRVREESVSTKVRDSGNSSVGVVRESDGKLESRDRVLRGATGVQTKGAYTPFPRPRPVETNRGPTGMMVSNDNDVKASTALSNQSGSVASSNRPVRAPFNIRLANP